MLWTTVLMIITQIRLILMKEKKFVHLVIVGMVFVSQNWEKHHVMKTKDTVPMIAVLRLVQL